MALQGIDCVMPYDPVTDTAFISAIGIHHVAANAQMVALAHDDAGLLDRVEYIDIRIIFEDPRKK